MSSIQNRIATTFTASGSQAIATMGQIAGRMTNIGQAAMQTGRMSERTNGILRAMGTTLRYAFAGSVIFGARNLLTTLTETQRQLALIGAIGGFDQMFQGAGEADKQLQSLYSNAQRGSIDALTPVGDFNDALVNLYSTVQDLDPNQAVKITQIIARGAQLAQVPVDDLTRSITGLNQAFSLPQNQRTIGAGVRGFFELTAKAPGGIAAGPAFTQQLAPLAAVSRLANVSPAQMYGLYLTSLRLGGTPATAGRGLQFLLQSLAAPSGVHASALRQAGITPDFVQRQGGLAAIMRLIQHARRLGVTNPGRAAKLTDDQLDLIDQSDNPGAAMAGLGISGRGVTFLTKAIGRIHGVRAVITLMSQMNKVEPDIQIMSDAMNNTAQAQHDYAVAWRNFARRQPLKAAAISLDVMRRQMITDLQGFINPPARAISGIGPWMLQHHRLQHDLVLGGAGFLAAVGVGRFLGAGNLPGVRRIPGLRGLLGGRGGLGRGFVLSNAVEAATHPTGVRGDSPQNPVYVTVVGEIFQGSANRPQGGPDVPGGGRATRFGRFTPGLGLLGDAALPVAGVAGVGGLVYLAAGGGGRAPSIRHAGGDVTNVFQRNGRWFETLRTGGRMGAMTREISEDRARRLMESDQQHRARLQHLQEIFSRYRDRGVSVRDYTGIREVNFKGKGEIEIDLLLNTPTGTIKKRVHIPADLWSGGRTPGSQGNRGRATRGR